MHLRVWAVSGLFFLASCGLNEPTQAGQQQLGTFDGSAVYSFEAPLVSPPDAATHPFAYPCGLESGALAAVSVYVDVNENGQLDMASRSVDHVLTSSDFPFEQLFHTTVTTQLVWFEMRCSVGTFGEMDSHLPLFDSRALDLATCPAANRYLAFDLFCGISPLPPEMSFYGNLYDDVANVSLSTSSPTTVLIDGVPRGKGTPSVGFEVRDAALSIGQHHLRAETDGLAWEATFTFPDRTWIRGVRPVGDELEIQFQEINGAESYKLFVRDWAPVTGKGSPLRARNPGPGNSPLTVSARFDNLPFGCHSSVTFTGE